MPDFNFKINSNTLISELFRKKGIVNFSNALIFIKNLPYGRNSNKKDLTLVISENKGTCSSKHALLKLLADENMHPEVKLMLGVFKMNRNNTPKIKNTLKRYNLHYIPEAHNYLKINGKIYDCTSKNSSESNFINDLIQEMEILPNQISNFKIQYHKDFLKDWIIDKPLTLEEVWSIREQCIVDLSSK